MLPFYIIPRRRGKAMVGSRVGLFCFGQQFGARECHRKMQPFEQVRLRCNAAGLLRAGEELDCSAHGVERHQNVEDESGEYDDCCDHGWEPKESAQKLKEEIREAIAPFQCCGFGSRMGLHDVQASAEHPAKVFATTTKVTCLTPFDETHEISVKFQCVAAREAIEAPGKEATKKRRAEKKNEQEKRLKRTVESADAVLDVFSSKLDGLNQKQMKSLCEANHLMLSGTKSQLKLRIINCNLFGHSGRCPNCGRSRMALVFANPDSCEPTHVECTFMHLKSRQWCVFGKKRIVGDRALLLPHKLKDDDVGTLRSVGIEVAAAAAGQL